MGIVLGHTLVATYLYYRNKDWFKCRQADDRVNVGRRHENINNSSNNMTEHLQQELHESLRAVSNISELKTALGSLLSDLLYATSKICIYFEDSLTEEKSDILKENLVSRAFRQKKRIISYPTDHYHPEYLSISPNTIWKTDNSVVVCLPVLGSREQDKRGVIVAVCDYIGEEQKGTLQLIENQRKMGCFKSRSRAISVPLEDAVITTNAAYKRLKSQAMGTDNKRDAAVLQLCAELFDPDATSLQLKVIKYLQEQTDAEIAFLLLNDKDNNDLFCQVVSDTVLQEEVRIANENEHSTFGVALKGKEPISEKDIPNKNLKELEKLLNISIQTFLCVPVISKADESLIALVCVANKTDGSRFCPDDVHIIKHCFKYTATVLTSTLAYQNERKLKDQTKALLQVARNLFTHLDDLTKLLREIMQEARNLTQAERCSVFLIDTETEELVAKVFDGITTDNNEPQSEIRFPRSHGIAGHVATKGELLNIRDAYSHPLFYRVIDENTGFRTRNILCFPIQDEKGCVIGVAQLCNKKTGPCFTAFDEAIASAFAVYCCISISHSLMYNKVIDSQARNNLINELMMYHMKVSPEETSQLVCETDTLTDFSLDFDKFSFAPRWVPENDTCKAVAFMFEDLGFTTRWRIRRDSLVRFILMVKKGYRNPPYHNWIHAFSVAHYAYVMVKNARLHEYLDELEIFALFVSCLCHDIDHRGTNNSFQVASQSVLAALYSSEGSVMERHHFAQSMCILNTEGCNIFENLPSKQYTRVLDLMRDIILATDLAHHLRILKDLEKMVTEGYDKNSRKHHKMLLCLLMTSCDLSDQTKCWGVTKHIAGLIYQEFFSQGDLEKALGHKPIEMMDRERAKIPEQQISFLDNIALPVFNVLARMFSECKECEEAVYANRHRWERICQVLKDRDRMPIDEVLALDFDSNGDIIGLNK
ncbi:cGMP-dependent 3',5'-cyclic phosphodiesterase isoform X2 [Octopus bimaculoides]|nr:cGMP-dependent 3',5'-cyclic phosphodiesterase isoform X2 [Octopus bimaculoides]